MKKNISNGYMRLNKKMLCVVILVFSFLLISIVPAFGYRYVIASYDVSTDTEESEINDYLQKLKLVQEHLAENGINSKIEETHHAVLLKVKKNILTDNDLIAEKLLIADILKSN